MKFTWICIIAHEAFRATRAKTAAFEATFAHAALSVHREPQLCTNGGNYSCFPLSIPLDYRESSEPSASNSSFRASIITPGSTASKRR